MGAQMRRMMEAAGQAMPESKPTMEINIEHPLLQRLDQEADEDRFADLAQILLDQAFLAEGSALEDPASYVARLNKLLVEMSDAGGVADDLATRRGGSGGSGCRA